MLSGCANYFWSLLNFRRTFAARITLIMSLRICFLTFLTAQGAPSSLTLICFDVDMIFRTYFVFNIAELVFFFLALFFDFALFVHFGHSVVMLVLHGHRGFLHGHESSHCRIRATNTTPPPVTWKSRCFSKTYDT